jgi:hypothetical protein
MGMMKVYIYAFNVEFLSPFKDYAACVAHMLLVINNLQQGTNNVG